MIKHTITERENVLRIINHSQDPEWVPLDSDCTKMVFSSVVQERPPFGVDGNDWFGCSWIWDADCLGFAPNLYHPYLLDDITKWRDVVKFPDLDAIDWKSAAEKDLEGVDRNQQWVRLFLESGPFERSHHLLGFQEAFLAMGEEPEEYKALIDAIADYKIKIIEKICEYYKPDEIFFQDDLGHAKGPMMSLDMYRQFLKPAHKRIAQAIRSRGVVYNHHSCGKMEAFIDDLIDIGVQIINPLQSVNNHSEIARKYADSVCFLVGVDAANYPSNSDEVVREDVRRIIDTFGPNKNLIVIALPTNVACMHQVEVAQDEARKYGSSFYSK